MMLEVACGRSKQIKQPNFNLLLRCQGDRLALASNRDHVIKLYVIYQPRNLLKAQHLDSISVPPRPRISAHERAELRNEECLCNQGGGSRAIPRPE